MDKAAMDYFSNSYQEMVAFLVKNRRISVDELQEIIDSSGKAKDNEYK